MAKLMEIEKNRLCYYKGMATSLVVFLFVLMFFVDVVNKGILIDGLLDMDNHGGEEWLIMSELRKNLWPVHYIASISLVFTSIIISLIVYNVSKIKKWSIILFVLSLMELANGIFIFFYDSPVATVSHYLLIFPFVLALYKTLETWKIR